MPACRAATIIPAPHPQFLTLIVAQLASRLSRYSKARKMFPFVERIIGDAGYQGPKMAAAVARTGPWKIEIVRRCDKHKFVVLPKRWIVERTIGWISRNRRLARDFERHCRIAAAFVRMAMIRIMLRRLAPKP